MQLELMEEKLSAALSRILSVCATLLAIFAVFNQVIGFQSLAIIEVASVLVISLLLWQLKAGRSPTLVAHGLLLTLLVVLVTAFVVGGVHDTGIYWLFLYPMLAFFLLDSRRALGWSIAMFVVLAGCIALDKMRMLSLHYSVEHIYLSIVILIIAAWLSFLSRQRLDHREALLDAANRELQQEIRWHRATRYHLQVILDYSPIAVWMLRAGKPLFVNHAARQWCLEAGIEECGADGMFYDRFPRDAATACKRYDESALASPGRPLLQRAVFPRADREERIVDLIHVCTDATASEVVVFAVDVSEQVHAEQKERDMEKRIQHVQKLESLGVMAGGIAHDFNNLLTIVMGNATLAQFESPANTDVTGMLDNIIRASEEASGLCQQMLAYAGKGLLAVSEIDLAESARGAGEQLAPHFTTGDIRYRFESSGPLPTVRADESQIHQVIMGLIANAREAIGDQAGTITLRTGIAEVGAEELKGMHGYGMAEPGRYVFLEVGDDGCGMDASTMARLFEPFFSTKFTGRGLGMSAVLGIVQAHHGVIGVKSEPGVGTHVRIMLPAAGEVEAAAPVAMAGKEPVAQPATGTVLLVDDEPGVRNTVGRMLETLGVRVLTAGNGREALEVLREKHGDIRLVLLDLTMPEMGGEECLRQLRETLPNLKVVLVSGYSENEAMGRFQDMELAGFMQKPFSLQKLKQLLEENVSEKAAG